MTINRFSALSAIAAVGSVAGPLFSSSAASSSSATTASSYWDSTAVMDDLKSSGSFSESDYPADAAMFGDKGDDGDWRPIAMADGIDAYKVAYVYFFHPSATALLYHSSFAQGDLGQNPSKVSISLSMTSHSTGFSSYQASVMGKSDDLRFWKMKISGDFTGQSSLASRMYELADLDVFDASGAVSNGYQLGRRFTFSTGSSGLTVKTDVIQTVKINGYADGYLFPGKNAHGGDSRGLDTRNRFGGSFAECRTILYNYVFYIDRSYGDVVGIRLDYELIGQWLKWNMWLGYMGWNQIDGEKVEVSSADYQSTQLKAFGDWDREAVFRNFVDRNPSTLGLPSLTAWLSSVWSATQDESLQIPVIERLSSPDKDNGWLKDSGNLPLSTNNPHLLSEEGNKKAMSYYSDKSASADVYVIHFDAEDEAKWIGGTTAIDGFSIWFRWLAQAVNPLQLTMRKDGKDYVLAVSADAVKAVVSTTGKAKEIDWDKIVRLVITFLALLLALWGSFAFLDSLSKGKEAAQ